MPLPALFSPAHAIFLCRLSSPLSEQRLSSPSLLYIFKRAAAAALHFWWGNFKTESADITICWVWCIKDWMTKWSALSNKHTSPLSGSYSSPKILPDTSHSNLLSYSNIFQEFSHQKDKIEDFSSTEKFFSGLTLKPCLRRKIYMTVVSKIPARTEAKWMVNPQGPAQFLQHCIYFTRTSTCICTNRALGMGRTWSLHSAEQPSCLFRWGSCIFPKTQNIQLRQDCSGKDSQCLTCRPPRPRRFALFAFSSHNQQTHPPMQELPAELQMWLITNLVPSNCLTRIPPVQK